MTPLFYGTFKNNLDMVKLLFEKGAHVNVRNKVSKKEMSSYFGTAFPATTLSTMLILTDGLSSLLFFSEWCYPSDVCC